MSDLKFNCPHCKQSLEAPDELLGKILECPACKQQIQVPKSQMRPAPQVALQNVTVEIKRGTSPLGIAALVIGIFACLFCWIPFLGLVAIPLALIGMLLAIIGAIMAIVSKKTGFVYPISGVLVCLIAVLIAFAITGRCAKAVSDVVENGQRTNQAVVPATSPSNKVSPSVFSPKTDNQPPLVPTVEWTNAASAVKQGDVQIQLKKVTVGKVLLKGMMGGTEQSQDELLAVTIVISNMSAGKKIDFSSWNGKDFSLERNFASMSDDNQNIYKRINFGMSSAPVGAVDRASIYPSKEISDVLVFEKPVDVAKWLHLELPANNFGGDGIIRFEIPATMIVH